jgi:anti-sigma regulatory factor (Ser/Thr protein kinase)
MRPAAPRAQQTSDVTYPGTVEHVCTVRADLRKLLLDCPIADDVILCASELAANAVLHSHSRLPGGTFTVRAAVSSGWQVRIEIEDSGGPWADATSNSTGRHGLDIVRALATESGIEGDHAGRTVWARFDWPVRSWRASCSPVGTTPS